MTLFFTCLLCRSICGTGNLSQQTSQQFLSTINIAFSDEDKFLRKTHKYAQHTQLHGNAEIAGLYSAGLDIDGLDIDGRMCG